RKMNPGVHRAYYFTSAVGGDDVQYEIQRMLRDFELEPTVITERADLAARRKNTLNTQGLIEKAKGVDIALAVRMLEDAYHQSYEECHLYTSDLDFLPVIQAVRARGKKVCIHGYTSGLGSRSPLLCEADLFVDMEEVLRKDCVFAAPE